MDSPGHVRVNANGMDGEMRQLKELQASREELLNRVHGLKSELQDWRYKMDSQVKNYRGELSALKETLGSEVAALRRELEETSERLKKNIVKHDVHGKIAGAN